MSSEISIADVGLLTTSAFAAALVAGIAGFAFGLVAAAAWLHFLSPAESAALILGLGAVVQGVAVWKLRRAVLLSRLWPFVVGGALGVPLGAELLRWVEPQILRAATGIVLVGYCAYVLISARLPAVPGAGRLADGGVGIASGVLGGATGLSGILPTVWCQIRGWPKDQQRAVFQPVAVVIHLLAAIYLGAVGLIGERTIALFALALPAVLAGTWVGLKVYGGIGDATFRRVVLALLLISGIALVVQFPLSVSCWECAE